MLDAAHGDRVRPVSRFHRVHVVRAKTELARTGIAGSIGGRRPAPTTIADTRQVSRRTVAVARSRRMKQSLA